MASDEETCRMYARREKALHDRASWLEDAEQEGLKKGMAQGMQQTALKMLEEGFEVDVISKITGLDRQQIESLR